MDTMIFSLDANLASKLTENEQSFAGLLGLKGKVYRQLEGRETLRVELAEQHYFIKKHFGVGWREIFKNLFQLKLPVLGARNEWEALKAFKRLQIPVPELLAYGAKGLNPAKQCSFVLMSEVDKAVSLEDYCRDWFKHKPEFTVKLRLLIEVAWMVSTMHRAGLNHRDCYLCHFLLKPDSLVFGRPVIYLIDLHRVQKREFVPFRWQVKDLAGLYFSSMDVGLTQRDLLRFLTAYFGLPWREVLQRKRRLLKRVEAKAHALYEKDFGRPAKMKRFY